MHKAAINSSPCGGRGLCPVLPRGPLPSSASPQDCHEKRTSRRRKLQPHRLGDRRDSPVASRICCRPFPIRGTAVRRQRSDSRLRRREAAHTHRRSRPLLNLAHRLATARLVMCESSRGIQPATDEALLGPPGSSSGETAADLTCRTLSSTAALFRLSPPWGPKCRYLHRRCRR